ncbi:arginine deiminase-related protein [Niabella terrae]
MITEHILMVRPAAFGFNEQTAVNNAFQHAGGASDIQTRALKEFDAMTTLLRHHGVQVTVAEDHPEPLTPDAIFPNNWVSFHEEGSVVYYPMFAPNRRKERTKSVMDLIHDNFYVRSEIDLTYFEEKQLFLEGTGSMILDRDNKLAYACLSPRTDASPLYGFCHSLGYQPVLFYAHDENGIPIYHTNVMMCLGSAYVVICMESIRDATQSTMLMEKFAQTGKTVIPISIGQMLQFAGNMLQVASSEGTPLLVMSRRAYNSLTQEQIARLESYNQLLHTPLDTIERHGGGSARCMMAEIFLIPKEEA